jgi:crotonobetainyl-CoA:carnitine CoA-transferase CaiB-like acyl-CoA transferase
MNKKGITLDLANESGRQLFKDLASHSDVVIENFKPGTMEKFGLSHQVLREINPRLIVASVSGFGQYGPYKDMVAFDLIAQAAGGLMDLTGYPDQPPVRAGTAIADILGALVALSSILTALYWRTKTNQGQYIDVSLMDSVFFTLGYEFIEHVNFGIQYGRSGNRYPGASVTDIFEAKDGYFVVQAPNDQMWLKLSGAIGGNALAEDQRFSTNLSRVENQDLVFEIIQQWSRDKSIDQITKILTPIGIPFFPVMNIDRLTTDASLIARNMIIQKKQPPVGEMTVPGIPLNLSATPPSIVHPAPSLGEHNQQIYGQLFNLSEDHLKKLSEDGVI